MDKCTPLPRNTAFFLNMIRISFSRKIIYKPTFLGSKYANNPTAGDPVHRLKDKVKYIHSFTVRTESFVHIYLPMEKTSWTYSTQTG